jgi:peptidoglycan/LPS O-acetylase OafA/YrhL
VNVTQTTTPAAPESLQVNGSSPSGVERLDFLDGVRAVAALWVVLSHLWISQFGVKAHVGLMGLASNWLLYSHFAVDVFIVLSGYCLTLPTVKDGGLRRGAVDFYRRRARRILPPYYIALAFGIVIAAVIHRLDHGTWFVDGKAIAINIGLLQDAYLRWNVFDGPLWSVAVEWRIYFLFPALLFILYRYGKIAVLAAGAAVGYALTAVIMTRYPSMLLACPWYLFLFTIGVAAAANGAGRPTRYHGAAILALLACVALAVHLHPITVVDGVDFGRNMCWIDAIVGAASALLLRRLHSDLGTGSPLLRFLSWTPLVTLGGFSYSLYLIHMLVIIVLGRTFALMPGWTMDGPVARFWIMFAVGLPVIIGLANLFYRAFERPFLSRSSRATR